MAASTKPSHLVVNDLDLHRASNQPVVSAISAFRRTYSWNIMDPLACPERKRCAVGRRTFALIPFSKPAFVGSEMNFL